MKRIEVAEKLTELVEIWLDKKVTPADVIRELEAVKLMCYVKFLEDNKDVDN